MCTRANFAVAIDGVDFEGHPIRRVIDMHCVGTLRESMLTVT
jgi:hypothetical protein